MDLERNSIGIGVRPALLLVDLSIGFCSPDSPLGGQFSAIVEANRVLLQAFRTAGLPICFTTVVYRDESEAAVFRGRLPALNILRAGSAWVKIDPRVQPLEGERVLEKKWASAFFGTDLRDWLAAREVDSLVIGGLTTSGCVRATVVDGLQHDYPVFVVREAVGDRNGEAHRANLHDMNAKYADVVGLDDLRAMLARMQSVPTGVESA